MTKEPKIKVSLYAQTHIGMVRHGNEDNFLVVDLSTAETWTAENSADSPTDGLQLLQGEKGVLIAVTDGMGGALAGEVASQMAVNTVRDRMLQFQATPSFSQLAFHERLRLSIEQANVFINVESQNNVEYTGMGATFTAAGLDGDTVYLAQVGDSRCYLLRENKIAQMTKDQSLVSQLVEAGHITEEEAESHTYKNVILQALGAQPRVNVIVDKVRLRKNDILLLCSDGLSGKMKGKEMLDIVNNSSDIKAACSSLINLANERGGEDNITVLIAKFDGEGLSEVDSAEAFKGEFIPRDPTLPDEIDSSQLFSDDSVLKPDGYLPKKKGVDVVETQEVQATMLNLPAITPQMIAAAQQQMATETGASIASDSTRDPVSPSTSNSKTPMFEDRRAGNSSAVWVLIIVFVTISILLVWYKFGRSSAQTPMNQQQQQEQNRTSASPPPSTSDPSTKTPEEIAAAKLQEKRDEVKAKLDDLTSRLNVLSPKEKDEVSPKLQNYRLTLEKQLLESSNQEQLVGECDAILEDLANIDRKFFEGKLKPKETSPNRNNKKPSSEPSNPEIKDTKNPEN